MSAALASPAPDDKSSNEGPAPPAPRPKGPPPRCSPATSGRSFVVHGQRDVEEGSEGGVDQPFAVELGAAAVLGSGFAVAALRHDGGRTEAVVALTDREVTRGQVVDLGRVFGAAEPPRLAARGDRVFVAVVDGDASGPTLRLARFEGASPQASLAWGAEVQQGRDESPAFSLALSPSGADGLLAWDDYDGASEHSIVRVASFGTESWGRALVPRNLSPADEDAEAPLIVARRGGYWAAWISHPAAPEAAAPETAQPPEARVAAEESTDELSLVESSPSQLRVALLDEAGKLVGEPRSVTQPSSQVVMFDLAAPGDGAVARLTWRDETRAPGAQGSALRVASVALDGTLREHQVDASALGAGVPTLLPDESARGADLAPLWLAATGTEAEQYLGLVTGSGVESFYVEPALATKQALVAGHGGILFAQPKGRDLVLGSVRCALRAAGAPEEPRPSADAGVKAGQEGD